MQKHLQNNDFDVGKVKYIHPLKILIKMKMISIITISIKSSRSNYITS